ncbi:MAG TPA: Smr/MutS family protein [Polyangia bacterium]
MPSRKPPSKSEPASARVWLDLGAEERRLFEKEFANVAPLRRGSDRVLPEASDLLPKDAGAGSKRHSREGAELVVDRQDGTITGASHGVSRETLRALARGEIRAESTCDLHGFGAEAARHRIQQWVRESAVAGRRAVLVICGRGLHSGGEGPVLRGVAVSELCSSKLRSQVLAFSTASPSRGGDGALAILLRRPPKSK